MKMLYVLLLVFCSCRMTEATLFLQQTDFYTKLTELYNPGINMSGVIARVNSTYARTIDTSVGLFAVQDIDEIEGTLELFIQLEMEWTDDIVTASGFTHDMLFNITVIDNPSWEVFSMLLPYNTIWTPKLVLVNSVDETDTVGSEAYRPRYFFVNGFVTWKPRIKIRSACSPDVTFYPFDKQTCEFEFTDWGQTSSELLFVVTRDDWDMSNFGENGEWSVEQTKTSAYTKSGRSWLKLSISVKRKPLYFAFNIILPILVLVFLNGMVFWLPVESGERVGFSVTCFLSFVVILNMVMDILPRSSSPMAYLCYYTVCMMIFSGGLTAVVILQMRLFHKPENEKVPKYLQSFVRAFRCKCKKNKVSDSSEQIADMGERTGKTLSLAGKETKSNDPFSDADEEEEEKSEITWNEVTRFLDMFFFFAFITGQGLFTFLFIVPVASNV